MAVRRRRTASKASTAPTSRVHAITSVEQLASMLAKAAAAKRLVVVQFYQAQNYTCAQMRAYYRRMSVDPSLKAAVFAEVEMDAAEPELLEECGLRSGRAKIPCYRCYLEGREVESYAGGVPAEVSGMLSRQLAQLRGSGGGLLPKLLLAAALAAAAAGAWWRLGRKQQGGAGGGDLAAEMRSLSERINIAQQRQSNAERAGRLKAAKNQRRILAQLRARQAFLEQHLAARDAPGAAPRAAPRGGAPAGGASDAEDGGGRGGRRRRRRRSPDDYSDEEEYCRARMAQAVLYSDEEE